MFDAGFFELLVIMTLGLLVLGPDKLPRVVRSIAKWIGQARRTVSKFQTEIERELAIEELREQQRKFEADARELGKTIKPPGSASEAAEAEKTAAARKAVDTDGGVAAAAAAGTAAADAAPAASTPAADVAPAGDDSPAPDSAATGASESEPAADRPAAGAGSSS